MYCFFVCRLYIGFSFIIDIMGIYVILCLFLVIIFEIGIIVCDYIIIDISFILCVCFGLWVYNPCDVVIYRICIIGCDFICVFWDPNVCDYIILIL